MKTQWQIYKELELIPESVSKPEANPSLVAKQVDKAVRSLATQLDGKLHHEQQVDHLEYCLTLNPGATDAGAWGKLRRSLGQFWQRLELMASSEPKIWQSPDRSGRMLWHIRDPKTGERIDLESEAEVYVWIEQSFYR
jgi:hypothetical protein